MFRGLFFIESNHYHYARSFFYWHYDKDNDLPLRGISRIRHFKVVCWYLHYDENRITRPEHSPHGILQLHLYNPIQPNTSNLCPLHCVLLKCLVISPRPVLVKNRKCDLMKNSFQLCVCLEFTVPLKNCLLLWWRHHCRWRAANFDLCSALMAIEQCGSLTCYTHCDTGLPYNDHLQRPVTLTSVADRLAVELSIPDFTT